MYGTNTTYSFSDVDVIISHPLVGQKSANGEGIGKLSISYTDNLTESDLGADGSTMISKIESGRGTITLEIQQTSSLNKWLLNYVNKVRNAATGQWAAAAITIEERFKDGVKVTALNVAPIKRPDKSNAQQGDHVSWAFFSPHIEEV